MTTKALRRVNLFDHDMAWTRRESDGGRKAPKRKRGQLLLRRYRGSEGLLGDWQPSGMPMWVPPCPEKLARPIPGWIGS